MAALGIDLDPGGLFRALVPSIAAFKARSKAALLGPYSAFVCDARRCQSCAATAGLSL